MNDGYLLLNGMVLERCTTHFTALATQSKGTGQLRNYLFYFNSRTDGGPDDGAQRREILHDYFFILFTHYVQVVTS